MIRTFSKYVMLQTSISLQPPFFLSLRCVRCCLVQIVQAVATHPPVELVVNSRDRLLTIDD